MIRWLILTLAAGYALQHAQKFKRQGYAGHAENFTHISAELLKMR